MCTLCLATPGDADPAVGSLLLLASLNITERLIDDTAERLGEAGDEPADDVAWTAPGLLRAATEVILARSQAAAVPPGVRAALTAWSAEIGAVRITPPPQAADEEPAVTATLVQVAVEVILDRAATVAPRICKLVDDWARTLAGHQPPAAEPGSLTSVAVFLAGRTL